MQLLHPLAAHRRVRDFRLAVGVGRIGVGLRYRVCPWETLCCYISSIDDTTAEIARDLGRGQRAGSSVEAGAGMRSRSAQIEVANRRAVPRPAEQRARHEELIERQLAVKDVAARQPVRPLEIERRDDLPRDDRRLGSRARSARSSPSRRRRDARVRRPRSCREGDTARTARTPRRRAVRPARGPGRRSRESSARSTARRRSCRISPRRTRARSRRCRGHSLTRPDSAAAR